MPNTETPNINFIKSTNKPLKIRLSFQLVVSDTKANAFDHSTTETPIISGVMRWPAGHYSLPMSVYGCPDPAVNNWLPGYMNVMFKQTIDLFETSIGRIGWLKPNLWHNYMLNVLELLGPYGAHSIQLNFCTHVHHKNDNFTEWPSGQYSVYGTEYDCPSGKNFNIKCKL